MDNEAIIAQTWYCDPSSINSNHTCPESDMSNLKICYDKTADDFWLSYLNK